jgi:two-component system, OmpR family, alkaline phosphatase synthesis response regulator PhoP
MNTILVVDDQSSVRQLLQEYLTEQGFRIVTAVDGQQAIYTARHTQPDLILLDIMMPRMDGYEVCRAVRDDPILQDVYLVLLTAKGQASDKLLGRDSGADLYLTKPFDPDELLEIAHMVLGADTWPK